MIQHSQECGVARFHVNVIVVLRFPNNRVLYLQRPQTWISASVLSCVFLRLGLKKSKDLTIIRQSRRRMNTLSIQQNETHPNSRHSIAEIRDQIHGPNRDR